MNTTKEKKQKRTRRHMRIRSRIFGTVHCPRLSFFKSNKCVYAQIIDDEKGTTLLQVSSKKIKGKTQIEKSYNAGEELAKKAVAKKIKLIVFDRGGFFYTGKVKAFADGARKGGLKF